MTPERGVAGLFHALIVTALALEHRAALAGDFRRQYRLGWGDVCALDAAEFCDLVAGLEEGRFSQMVQTSPRTVAPSSSATVEEDAAAYLRRVRKLRGRITMTRSVDE